MTTAAHFSKKLFPSCKRAAQQRLKYSSTTQTVWAVESQLAQLGLIWSQFNTASKGITERLFCPHNLRRDKEVCENCLAYLPRCRTATCLCHSLSLSRPLSLICVKRPAVSNHSLSVTLNLICKCDTWGQSPVLRVCPATTHALLRLVRALRRYFWMSLFSLCCSVTAGNRTSANCKLSHRPQMLPLHVYNKPYKREITKTKQQKAFVNLPAEVTNADGNNSISISFSPLDNACARNWSLVQISPWNVANIRRTNTHASIEDCIDWRGRQ